MYSAIDPALGVILAALFTAFGAVLVAWINRRPINQIKNATNELRRNGGSSMKDGMDQVLQSNAEIMRMLEINSGDIANIKGRMGTMDRRQLMMEQRQLKIEDRVDKVHDVLPAVELLIAKANEDQLQLSLGDTMSQDQGGQ